MLEPSKVRGLNDNSQLCLCNVLIKISAHDFCRLYTKEPRLPVNYILVSLSWMGSPVWHQTSSQIVQVTGITAYGMHAICTATNGSSSKRSAAVSIGLQFELEASHPLSSCKRRKNENARRA